MGEKSVMAYANSKGSGEPANPVLFAHISEA